MKLINTILLIGVFIYISFNSNAQVENDKINGDWKVVSFSANTPSLSPSLLKGAREEALSSTYSFRTDKTFTMQSEYVTPPENGYWNISDKNEIIMNYNPGGKQNKEIYKIELLNSSTMKWSQDMGELGSLTMTLKKK
jgi:hypothetical protein